MKRVLTVLTVAFLLGGLALATAGCNTLHGAGKDIERAGQKVQEATE